MTHWDHVTFLHGVVHVIINKRIRLGWGRAQFDVVDRFYRALFSVVEQTHCDVVADGSK